MLQLNSIPYQIHIFIGLRTHQSISGLFKMQKTQSSKWIKAKKICKGSFGWQNGYGAFSYSKSHFTDVIRYV